MVSDQIHPVLDAISSLEGNTKAETAIICLTSEDSDNSLGCHETASKLPDWMQTSMTTGKQSKQAEKIHMGKWEWDGNDFVWIS